MIDITFTYADLEYFLLVLVRITCFVYVAPFFSMSNTPRMIRVGFSIFLSYLVYMGIDRNEVVYNTLLGSADRISDRMGRTDLYDGHISGRQYCRYGDRYFHGLPDGSYDQTAGDLYRRILSIYIYFVSDDNRHVSVSAACSD